MNGRKLFAVIKKIMLAMKKEKLLAEFVVKEGESATTYKAYGEYAVKTGKNLGNTDKGYEIIDYSYPEFKDVLLTRIIDDKESIFVPNESQWQYEYDDERLCAFLSAVIRGDEAYECRYLDPGLHDIVDEFVKTSEVAVTINGKSILWNILINDWSDTRKDWSDMGKVYSLLMVTSNWIYYRHKATGEYYMLDVDSHSISINDYFLSDSLRNIEKGKETLLWGELPDEEY